MSRGQINQTFDTAKDQNSTYYNEAQNSYTNAQSDVKDYQDQLAKYAAGNPYNAGGAFQKSTNQVLANTSDAGARSAGEALQSQALRTGQNSAGAIAATERMQEQGTRDMASEEAKANQERIAAGASYNKGVLGATEFPAQFAAEMAKNMTGAAGDAAKTELGAASWNDPAADTWNKAAANTATAFGGDEAKNITGKS